MPSREGVRASRSHGVASASTPLGSQGSFDQVRELIVGRLRARWPEIEQAVMARVYSISDPRFTHDSAYLEGLRSTVSVALDYALAVIAHGDEEGLPPPGTLLAQARLAAKNQIGLATVTRRYVAGYTLLSEFVVQEAVRSRLSIEVMNSITRAYAVTLDNVLAAVTAEYAKVAAGRGDSSRERRVECVRSLLAGEAADVTLLAYGLEDWHLGVLASGPGAEEVVRSLADTLDRRVLVVAGEVGDTVWGWLGGAKRLEPEQAVAAVRQSVRAGLTVALGEAAHGLDGWRLTHRQAVAALDVARHGGRSHVRYADVAMVAAVLKDQLLAVSLRQIYIEPLAAGREGETLLATLRAYFAAERNTSSAAVALGVKRHTVTNRLRTVEERLGRRLASCGSDLEMALLVHGLDMGSMASAASQRL